MIFQPSINPGTHVEVMLAQTTAEIAGSFVSFVAGPGGESLLHLTFTDETQSPRHIYVDTAHIAAYLY